MSIEIRLSEATKQASEMRKVYRPCAPQKTKHQRCERYIERVGTTNKQAPEMRKVYHLNKEEFEKT